MSAESQIDTWVEPHADTWPEANQAYLDAAVGVLRARLVAHLEGGGSDAVAEAQQGLEKAAEALPRPSALDMLCRVLDLTPFERDVLLLSVAPLLDPVVADSLTAAGGSRTGQATFEAALAVLPGGHWSALTPDAPLRGWRLLELETGATLTRGALTPDERIFHYLLGIHHIDERLKGYLTYLAPEDEGEVAASQGETVERIASVWSDPVSSRVPAIQLIGSSEVAKRVVAVGAAAAFGAVVYTVDAGTLPTAPPELEALTRLMEREMLLSGGVLLLVCEGPGNGERERDGTVVRFIDHLRARLLVSTTEPRRGGRRPVVTLEATRPTREEQRALWHAALGGQGEAVASEVDRLITQFDLDHTGIRAACRTGMTDADAGEADLSASLWRACRAQARPSLDRLALHIPPVAAWDELVLPVAQKDLLAQIVTQVRQRATVYHDWGFAARSPRGLGITTLFCGSSGTGKTMAAEVLAAALGLDLYRIDLSQVVSKYIGETEKNLCSVFDSAEEGGAVLLFDEADALFGKRSEVKDSHDRYANIEVGYLLQRMEQYRGLAVLTTNMKQALDPAFQRRIRFTIQFPFPDAAHRARIWRRIFPPDTPTDGLDPVALGRLNMAGGTIRNIALGAAFLAAEAGGSVTMGHIREAVRAEFLKLEKPFPVAETKGWK